MSSLFQGLVDRYLTRKAMPYWVILLLDSMIVIGVGFLVAYWYRGGLWFTFNFWSLVQRLIIIMLVYWFFFKVFHTYAGVVRFSTFKDLRQVAKADVLSLFVLIVISSVARKFMDEESVCFDHIALTVHMMLVTAFIWFARMVVKNTFDSMRVTESAQKVFIYGTGAGAVAMAKSLQNMENVSYVLAGFVNPLGEEPFGEYLMGVRVWEDNASVIQQMQKEDASRLLVSPLMTERFRGREDLINGLIDAGIKIVILPNPEEWDGKSRISSSQLREVDIEDLLPREIIDVNLEKIAGQLQGRSVLITGAAGSIGYEIVRQVALFHPSHMVLVDQAETPMHKVLLMMNSEFGKGCPDESRRIDSNVVVASITDSNVMEGLFSAYRPDYVFHAAAYKHVPMMEDNPAVAIRNNFHGTRIIADLAVKYDVSKFVMISTDKAVNPTNVMGCSKRLCEIYCQSLNNAIQSGKVKGKTQFVTTRFGNVLGSNGSVIPLFREQIAHGGPVTVTTPEIIRYFMLIPEACKLVLEAGVMGRGGEIFVFDMGEPVRIVDLARKMIALSGAKDVQIVFTGLRDGEKLYEEVLSDKEKTMPTPHPKIWVASVREYDYGQACRDEERLVEASYSGSACEIVKLMEEIVPEYRSTNEKYK